MCIPLEILECLLEEVYRSEALRDGNWENGAPAGASKGEAWEWERAVCLRSRRDVGKKKEA